ncbi:MAG: hypothetical protein ABI416_18045 [Ginsengibacter sp.]
MKQSGFLATLSVATCMSLFLFSCGSGGDKSAETTADTSAITSADTPAVTPPEPPAAAQPFKLLLIRHKVANFAKWKPGYESHDSMRQAAGLKNFIIGRGLNDSNMVLIMLLMNDVSKAKELTTSPNMKERMQKAGVIGKPMLDYLEILSSDTSKIEQTARLMITHKVKDWDAWKKEFDDHKQARMDAGLVDRGVSYSDDDHHKVTLIFAVTDMQKANAFLNSKDLKDKMAKAGVEGPPSLFFYNIVQKY